MTQSPIRLIGALWFAVAIAFCQPKDVTGWSKIKWGMTALEAKAAFGEQASELSEEHTRLPSSLVQRFTVKDILIGDIVATALVFSGDSDRVSLVTIQATRGNDPADYASMLKRTRIFSTLKRLLIEKYGTPKNEDRKRVGSSTESTVLWSFPSTSITLYWSEPNGAGWGMITIQYRAVDPKSLNPL